MILDVSTLTQRYCNGNIDGLMHERRNSIANAMELRLYCINPSISLQSVWRCRSGWAPSWVVGGCYNGLIPQGGGTSHGQSHTRSEGLYTRPSRRQKQQQGLNKYVYYWIIWIKSKASLTKRTTLIVDELFCVRPCTTGLRDLPGPVTSLHRGIIHQTYSKMK